LDDLRQVLDERSVRAFASRLNRAGTDRLAATWEIFFLRGLAKSGLVRHEDPIASGRRPDVFYESRSVSFVADVTCVSDSGLHEQNPFQELMEVLERRKRRWGFPVGGLHLDVEGSREWVGTGWKTILKLPDRRALVDYVRSHIEPEVIRQKSAGRGIIEVRVEEPGATFTVRIDPSRSPNSGGSHPSYTVPPTVVDNPLYKALHAKAKKLKSVDGAKGIMVGDGHCSALAGSRGNRIITPDKIVSELFRQHSSIDFVFLVSVHERQTQSWTGRLPPKQILPKFYARGESSLSSAIKAALDVAVESFPKPINSPLNAAHRAREKGYGLGFHGGYSMSDHMLKIGSRALLEVLSGRVSIAEFNKRFGWRAGDEDIPNKPLNPFERQLREGRLFRSIDIDSDDDAADDWVTMHFGQPDPAISKFK